MPTAKNAAIYVESAPSEVSYAAMTDSGDHIVFNPADNLLSVREGYEAVVRPNGIVSGVNMITPAVSGSNNLVDVAAFTCYIAGVLVSVSADTDITVARGTGDGYIISSVIVDSSGTLSVVQGTESTAFSTTRGSAGGPPSIPLAQVEVGQIRYTSTTAAAVLSTEIKQNVEGGYCERYDYPVWSTNPIGDGNQATDADKKYAYVEFVSALPMIHGATATSAATATKKVYATYHTPVFMLINESVDFVPAEESTSVSSTQIYRKTIGASSMSLGSGSFTAMVTDGISDTLSKLEGEKLTFKFFPNINNEPYSITQGYMSLTTSYPASDNISVAATIAAEQKTVKYDS